MQTVVRNGGAKARARNGTARKGRGNEKRTGASSQKSTSARRQKGSDAVGRDRKAVKESLEFALLGELDPALRAAGCRGNSRLGGFLRDVSELHSITPPPPKTPGGELSLDEIRLHNKNEVARFISDLQIPGRTLLRDRLFALVDAGEIETADVGELGTFINRHVMRHENREAAQSLLPMFHRAFHAWEEDARPNRQGVGQATARETQPGAPSSDAVRARTMVPLADVVRATELLQLMHDNGDMDDNSCNCTDFAVFLYNKGNAEDRTEALLVLAPLADRLYDRLVEAESKD